MHYSPDNEEKKALNKKVATLTIQGLTHANFLAISNRCLGESFNHWNNF